MVGSFSVCRGDMFNKWEHSISSSVSVSDGTRGGSGVGGGLGSDAVNPRAQSARGERGARGARGARRAGRAARARGGSRAARAAWRAAPPSCSWCRRPLSCYPRLRDCSVACRTVCPEMFYTL